MASGRFVTPCPPILHVGRRLAITLEDHRWQEPDGTILTLTRGFPTDGASLPWIALRRWDPWEPRILTAALFHDAGYSLHGTELDMGPRDVVDRRFRGGMRCLGFRASGLFWGVVRAAGWWSWGITPNNHLMRGYLEAVRAGAVDGFIANLRR